MLRPGARPEPGGHRGDVGAVAAAVARRGVIGSVLYVRDAAGARHHAVRVEVGVAGRSRAVVEPRVGHVYRKVERRGKPLHPQPRQIPRTRRLAPGRQVPSHDLRAPLVEEPRHRVGHHRDDRGICRESVHLGPGQFDELGREPSDAGIGSRAQTGARDRPSGIRAVRARQRLNRNESRVAARRHALAQLVGTRHPRDRAHRRNGPDEAGQPLDLVPARVHDVRVLRHVLHDPGAAVAKAVEPGVLDRSRELDQCERLVGIRCALRRQRAAASRRIELAAGQAHLAHVVAAVRAGAPEIGLVLAACLDQRESLVARQRAGIRLLERGGRLRGVRDEQQMRRAVRRGRLGAHKRGGHDHAA